ncbi:hypothetical protein [Nocardia farcinica]|nr:hypothetical protein [Nocardia farcinica]
MRSRSGTGTGLYDNIGLAQSIPYTVPDGNTDHLRDIATAWEKLGRRSDIRLSTRLLGPITEFQHINSDDAAGIADDLQELARVASDVFDFVDHLHKFSWEQHECLFDLRSRLLPAIIHETAAPLLVPVKVTSSPTAIHAEFSPTSNLTVARAALSAAMHGALESWHEARDTSLTSSRPSDIDRARAISDEIRDRETRYLDREDPDVTFDDPKRPNLGSDGKYRVNEGDSEIQIDDPNNPARTITDIDRIEGGILWEEKSATSAADIQKWVDKQVTKKLESYMEAQQYIAGYEDSPIGIEFTSPGVDPAFKSAVEQAVAEFKANNPATEIVVKWPP